MEIELTEDILEKGKSKNGGWSMAQLNLFGVLKLKKGWKNRIIGQSFSKHTVERFLLLKDKHLEKTSVDNVPRSLAENLIHVDQDLPVEEQYKHQNWVDLRRTILQRDNYTCKICSIVSTTAHVHHLKYPIGKYVWQIEHQYLITVCKDCHKLLHDRPI